MNKLDEKFEEGKEAFRHGEPREIGTTPENISHQCGWDWEKFQSEKKILEELTKNLEKEK